ncbi:MAG: NADH-quinone oxidoreductase subunit I [Rhodothermales bacterium]
MPGTPANLRKENERDLNLWERMYLPKVFSGLGYSFRKMQLPSYTVEYPEEQWYPPDSYRGRPVLVEEDGKPRCVSCNLCARACPPMAISMQSHEIEGVKEREPKWFEINMLRCIYCGYCEEVCPEEAIVMSKEYDLTFQSRDEAIFGLERLLMPKEQLKDRLDYLDAYKDPQFGQQWQFPKENNIHSLKDRQFLSFLADQVSGDGDDELNLEDPAVVSADADWGSDRGGPPASHHQAE